MSDTISRRECQTCLVEADSICSRLQHLSVERTYVAVDAFRALLDAAEDMRSYVPEYFATKWAHDDALDRARRAIEAIH